MDKATFEAADPLIDEVAELAEEVLTSDQLARVREALIRLGNALGDRYSVNLSVVLEVYDREKERSVPLLTTGLSISENRELYRTYGDSSEQRYIVDGEMQIVPHDRCPKCWGAWDFKWLNHSCPHCDAALGVNSKILLDTDMCPHCENGRVSVSNPVCERCGFQINPAFVVWG